MELKRGDIEETTKNERKETRPRKEREKKTINNSWIYRDKSIFICLHGADDGGAQEDASESGGGGDARRGHGGRLVRVGSGIESCGRVFGSKRLGRETGRGSDYTSRSRSRVICAHSNQAKHSDADEGSNDGGLHSYQCESRPIPENK